jgi:hypothetical protein
MSGLISTLTQLSLSNPFAGATINSFFVILVTEIGDKTFFIAAVLAMRHSRFVIYAGAMGALALMHVLSCFMGYALPALIPKQYTHTASAVSCFHCFIVLLMNSCFCRSVGLSNLRFGCSHLSTPPSS